MNQTQSRQPYPNVKVRLRLTKIGPDLPDREYYMTVWLKDRCFHICDEAGRGLTELLGDLSAPRGLGVLPHSLEEMMDIHSEALEAPGAYGTTELYGDLATSSGWVFEYQQTGWPIIAAELAPLAEQILAPALYPSLMPGKSVTRLSRQGTEYRGFLEGEEAGFPYKSAVTCIIAAPYLLFSHVRDMRLARLSYTREVVVLEEGVVTDADITPPQPS